MTWPTHFYDLNLDRHPATPILWQEIREHPDQIWMLRVSDPIFFLASLPEDFKPPIPGRQNSCLPKNIWVGGRFSHVWPDILSVSAATRFLVVQSNDSIEGLVEAMEAWRCSSCGTRGVFPRPEKCPHAVFLCGDAKLLPQIHWLIMEGPMADGFRMDIETVAEKTGVQIHG